MDQNINLIAHNIISIISTITLLGMAFFTFLNGRNKVANITWSLFMLSITVFTISHVIGVNVKDPNLSRIILMFNLSIFFIGAFNLHSILALVDLDKQKKWLIRLVYGIATVTVLFFIIYPDLFLVQSVPKMYFPNYYEPGPLNIIRVLFLHCTIVPFCIYLLYKKKNQVNDTIERKQYLYTMYIIIVGYAISFIPNFLIYDIPIDPLWGMSFSTVFSGFFTYGAIRYNLFGIKVIAKQALIYSISIILVGIFIVIFTYSNQWILVTFPNFPIWISPLISSTIIVTLSFLVWRNLRDGDILKYEFITTVTHKFRTPLTHIKWAAENLSSAGLQKEDRMQIEYIQNANSKLVELTNLLVNVSEEEKSVQDYHLSRGNLSELVNYVTDSLVNQSFSKHINLRKNIQPSLFAVFDEHRMRFVTQTLVENALNYTPSGGTVTVELRQEKEAIICAVSDSGIGIPQTELPLLFSKFYRGSKAKTTDTEGMGIGLFMSKEILEHHNGRIWAQSPGSGLGSTFSYSIPIN